MNWLFSWFSSESSDPRHLYVLKTTKEFSPKGFKFIDLILETEFSMYYSVKLTDNESRDVLDNPPKGFILIEKSASVA